MSRPRARFARIARLQYPTLTRALNPAGRDAATAVLFTDGSRGHLPAPAHDAGLLEALQQAGRPAWLAFEDEAIRHVLAPVIGRVVCFAELPDHSVQVGLDASPMALSLRGRDAEGERVREVLRHARETQGVVLVAADQSGAIVDADIADGVSTAEAPAFGPRGAEPLEMVPVTPVPQHHLPTLFERVERLDCGPLAAPPCLPFRHPLTGSNARAHRICETLARDRVTAGKVWVFDFPTTRTRHHPHRLLRWHWHVAAFVRVDDPATPVEAVRVIDPSLHDGFATLATFRKRLGVPPTALRFSRAACYLMNADGRGVEPRPGQVDHDLAICRALARGARAPHAADPA